MMLRMPSAWAPINSAWSAIRFLSREVKWIRVSMPTWCWIMRASERALIRTRAIGLSPMLMASAPASLMSSAPAMHLAGLRPRGGSISTLTTNALPASRCAIGVGGSCSAGLRSIAIAAEGAGRWMRVFGAPGFSEGHLSDDREVGGLLRRGDCGQEFGQVGEGLEHEEVGTAFEERGDLFFEGRRCLGDTDAADRLELLTDRPDRSGNEDLLARDLAGFASQLDRPEIDVTDAPFQAMAGELDSVRAEGIGLDQLSAGGNVRAVNFLDDFGLGEVELVERALEADAARVKLGAHGAIAQQRPAAKPLEEGIRSFCVGCHGPQ